MLHFALVLLVLHLAWVRYRVRCRQAKIDWHHNRLQTFLLKGHSPFPQQRLALIFGATLTSFQLIDFEVRVRFGYQLVYCWSQAFDAHLTLRHHNVDGYFEAE